MKRKKGITVLVSLLLGILAAELPCSAQFDPQLRDKRGAFEILRRTDFADAKAGFTASDNQAALQRIEQVVATLRLNPVLSDIKGFNGRARIHGMTQVVKGGWAVPSRVSFEFSSFFYNKKGEVSYNAIEPPEWSVYLNCPNGIGIASDGFDSGLGYFTVPLRRTTLAPGVDVYGDEYFVLYNPSRPDYWVPVTVAEAFASARAFAAKETDAVAAGYYQQFLDKEWAEVSAYKNQPAYLGGGLSRVSASPGYGSQDSIFPQIMKVNPAYWDKTLSKGSIQIISLHSVQDKVFLRRELESCYQMQDRGSGCDLSRFELALSLEDMKRLQALIGK